MPTVLHDLSGNQGKFPWRDIPRAEGKGNLALFGKDLLS
jgi:hypothetical protein